MNFAQVEKEVAKLRQDVGAYTRCRVKKWQTGRKFDIIPDELMIYAIVKNREQLYYMEYKSYFKSTLDKVPEGTPVQLRYVRRFPKFWKRHLYDLRKGGIPIIRYSAAQLVQKQEEIWKFTGIMGGDGGTGTGAAVAHNHHVRFIVPRIREPGLCRFPRWCVAGGRTGIGKILVAGTHCLYSLSSLIWSLSV